MKRIMLLSTSGEPLGENATVVVHKKLIVAKLSPADRTLLLCCTKFPFADDGDEGTHFKLAVYLADKYGRGAYWEDLQLGNDFARNYLMQFCTDDDEKLVGSAYDVLLKAPCIVDCEVENIDWHEDFVRWREKINAFYLTREPTFETTATGILLKENRFLKAHIKKFNVDAMQRRVPTEKC
jgi:hypothetical protein